MARPAERATAPGGCACAGRRQPFCQEAKSVWIQITAVNTEKEIRQGKILAPRGDIGHDAGRAQGREQLLVE